MEQSKEQSEQQNNEQSVATFLVTDSASSRIAYLLADEPTGASFVISVLGGGCSGFQYNFDIAVKPRAENDLFIEKEGARILVDDVSLGLLKGSALDYTEDLAHSGFVIKNPNATAKCGCGNSFSVL